MENKNPYAEIALVTPKKAEQLLKMNTDNRNLNERKLREYVDSMNRGQWRLNGSSISISESKKLLDGQHRLTAVIKSNTSQSFVLVHNLKDEVFTTIDTGKNRNASDALKILGKTYTTSRATLATKIIIWNRTETPILSSSNNDGGGYGGAGTKPSIEDIISFVNQNDLDEYILKSYSLSSKFKGIVVGEYAFLYYIFSKIDIDDADEFFEIFTTGYYENMIDNPVIWLRNKIINIMGSNVKFTGRTKAIFFIKAWNLFREKKSCKMIKIYQGEEIPKPI